jgi:hypothetical protein
MINAFVILSREINVNYMGTNPASFSVWTDPGALNPRGRGGGDVVSGARSVLSGVAT